MGISDILTKDNIVNAIKAQNNIVFKSITCFKIFESHKKRNSFNAILEVDGDAFKKIMEIGKINVEWNRCMVYEKVDVLRCFKCWGYNHKSSVCKKDACCFKCGGFDHVAKECVITSSVCLNCDRAKKNLNLDSIDVNHDTLSVNCPIYIKKIKATRNKISY